VRVAVLSDIHGNLAALQAVLADVREQKVDELVVLGDLVSKGPEGNEVVEAIRGISRTRTTVIMGGGEELLAAPGRAGDCLPNSQRLALYIWEKERLTEESIQYLTALPYSHRVLLPGDAGGQIAFYHASPWNTVEIINPDAPNHVLEKLFVRTEDRIVCYGHIHRPFVRFVGGRVVVNAGSVGQPFDGDPRACYFLLSFQGGRCSFELRKIPYDVNVTINMARRTGMPGVEVYAEMMRNAMYPLASQD